MYPAPIHGIGIAVKEIFLRYFMNSKPNNYEKNYLFSAIVYLAQYNCCL
jgi:hypothetical protein